MRPRSQRPYPYTSSSDDMAARRAPVVRAHVPPVVCFVEQTDTEYAVGELFGPRTALVAKRRAIPDSFPPVSGQQMHGRRLLRWSLYALVGAGLGGIVGVVLGGVVVLVALLRLARFSGKVRHWRRTQRARGEGLRLPSAATSERLCLLAALSQGLVAVVMGALVVLVLVGFF